MSSTVIRICISRMMAPSKVLLAALVIVFLAQPLFATDLECERRPGYWWCRVCHEYHPNAAVICPRHPNNPDARLEIQKQRFRQSLQPFFSANPVRVIAGQSTELTWYTHCATRVRIEPGMDDVSAAGAIRVRPTSTTSYKLVVESPWSDWMEQPSELTIQVLPGITDVELNVSPRRVFAGDSVEITWKASSANKITLEPGSRSLPPSGHITSEPLTADTTFRIVAEQPDTPAATAEVKVEVIQKPSLPDLAPVPDYDALFKSAAPTIEFASKLPKVNNQSPYYFPVTERRKLDNFAEFLQQNPGIDFAIVGYAYEYLPRQPAVNRTLATLRRDLVANYLQARGIAANRMDTYGENTVINVSHLSAVGATEPLARATGFLFRHVAPVLQAKIVPMEIQEGESAIITWATQNATGVSINGEGLAPRGEIRVKPGQNSEYFLNATNGTEKNASTRLAISVVAAPPAAPKPTPEPSQLVRDNVVNIFFAPESASLGPFALKMLDQDALNLLQPEIRNLPVQIRASIGAGEKSLLAQARAEACRKQLIKGGIEPERLRITLAQSEPDDIEGSTPAAIRWLSQRVEILYDPSHGAGREENGRKTSRPVRPKPKGLPKKKS
ncbi:MAG TPA: hypothetical protein VJW20_01920 [Candidatus Angelobacter sp.]|nr:hypothetical protein [Candidatus Angelobacter sp.]